MKEEYDFSKGERGKFSRPDASLNLPIYLESETLAFVEDLAAKKKVDMSKVVNDLIRTDMEIADYTK